MMTRTFLTKPQSMERFLIIEHRLLTFRRNSCGGIPFSFVLHRYHAINEDTPGVDLLYVRSIDNSSEVPCNQVIRELHSQRLVTGNGSNSSPQRTHIRANLIKATLHSSQEIGWY